MTATPFEHAGAARAALAAIVSDPAHGAAALDSSQTTANLLQDLLPDAPRESDLLIAAARAGVPAKLRADVAQGMDITTAVSLAAAALAARTAFTPDACAWVASELAIALGLAPAGGVRAPEAVPPPASAQAEPAPRQSAATTAGLAHAGQDLDATGVATTPTGSAGSSAGPRRGRRRAILVPLGVILAVVAAAGGYSLANLTSHTGTAAGGSPGPGGPSSLTPSLSQPATQTPGQQPSSSPAPSGTPTPSQSVIQPVISSLDDVWIAQLASVPVRAGAARLDAVLAAIRVDVPGAQVLQSGDFASLNAGFWVVYYQGSFTNGVQALGYCAAHHRPTKTECIGRFLSHNPADFQDQCYPPAASPSGNCGSAATSLRAVPEQRQITWRRSAGLARPRRRGSLPGRSWSA